MQSSPYFLSYFNQTWISSTCSINIHVWNFMKIRPVGAELFCGQTDMTKLIVAFGNFANAPKNVNIYSLPSAFTCKSALIMCVCCEAVSGPCKARRLQSSCMSAFIIPHQLPVTLESAICTGNFCNSYIH